MYVDQIYKCNVVTPFNSDLALLNLCVRCHDVFCHIQKHNKQQSWKTMIRRKNLTRRNGCHSISSPSKARRAAWLPSWRRSIMTAMLSKLISMARRLSSKRSIRDTRCARHAGIGPNIHRLP